MIEQTEVAKFWLEVMNDLKSRGLGDMLIAVVDGLKGFPRACRTSSRSASSASSVFWRTGLPSGAPTAAMPDAP